MVWLILFTTICWLQIPLWKAHFHSENPFSPELSNFKLYTVQNLKGTHRLLLSCRIKSTEFGNLGQEGFLLLKRACFPASYLEPTNSPKQRELYHFSNFFHCQHFKGKWKPLRLKILHQSVQNSKMIVFIMIKPTWRLESDNKPLPAPYERWISGVLSSNDRESKWLIFTV